MLAVATAAEAVVRADVLWLEEDEVDEEEEEDEATLAEEDDGKNARRARAHATRRSTRSTTRRRYSRSRRTDGSAGAGVVLMEGEALRRMVERREGSAVAQQLAAYRIERHRSLHVIIVRALGRMGDAYLSMDGVGGSERSEWKGRLYRWRLQWESWRGRLACGDAVAGIA